MRTEFRPTIVILLLMTLLTGGVYPLAVTAIAKIVFPGQAEGGLVVVGGRVVGSRLIGQPFDSPRYFWSRLSATGPFPYNAAASTGSNYGPLNPALLDAARTRIAALRAADPEASLPVPIDLVTASGSGLDPHISPAAAEYQVRRVARARGVEQDVVRRLIRMHASGRTFGILGEPTVNVLELNLALDRLGR
jgi:K+-transporting ATPase ATPase C chain